MINRLFLCLYILLLCFTAEASSSKIENLNEASDKNSTEVSISCTSKNNALLLKVTIPQNTKIYWAYSGDAGYNTNIDLSNSLNLDKYKVMWPFPKTSLEEGKKYYYYENTVYIPILIKPIDYSKTTELSIKIDYLLCSDGFCKPEKIELKHRCKIKNEFVEVDSIIPVKQKINNGKLKIKIKDKASIVEILSVADIMDHLLISDAKTFALKPIEVKLIDGNTAKIKFSADDPKLLENKKLFLFSDRFDLPVELKTKVKSNDRIIKILLLALIGGFVLNFMPCVLPVLSIKLLSIMNAPKRNYKIRAIFTFLGIIIAFISISVVSIIFKISGEYFNVGFHFQNYKFVVCLCIIVVTLISSSLDRVNLFRHFERLAFLNINLKYIEDIFIGIVSTLIATPCIGPFLSTVLAFAITSENHFINLIVFSFIGIGFGIPYLLLIFSPKVINFIPKLGKLVFAVKKISSLLLAATLMWLLYIINGLLGYTETILLAMILFLYKFIIESDGKFLKNKIFKVLMISCMVIASFYLPKIYRNNSVPQKIASQSIWEEFDENLMNRYISEGEIVLIDITADWCATCKINKLFLWDRDWTVEFLKKHNIKCLRADITNEKLKEDSFNSTKVFNFMDRNKIYGIPYNAVFSSRNIDGTALPVNLSFSELKNYILNEVKKK